MDRRALSTGQVKDVQLLQPLFEFSGACAGCGETPYIKLMTQLFGDRALIGNATGCSSIYGGNLPTTPYTVNDEGRGPTWSNSLFEDNAEFALGMRLAIDQQAQYARDLLHKLSAALGDELVQALLNADQSTESGIREQRERVHILKSKLAGREELGARDLMNVSEALVKKSVWAIGGDGWAYDIGYGGLDHVLSSGRDINILVLDTEVYSNTGGQMSKSTPRGAVAKFAAGGKPRAKKDLGMMAIKYGNVYVAQVAMGGSDMQTLKAFNEADAHHGPSLIIAYSHCIAHGYDLVHGCDQQKAAVQTGYWPLYRYNPELGKLGKNPFQLDSRPPSLPLDKYIYNETRYTMLVHSDPEAANHLLKLAEEDVRDPLAGLSKSGRHADGGRRKGGEVNDRPDYEISELEAQESARRFGLAAFGGDRQHSPHGGCGRFRRCAPVPIRGADSSGEQHARSLPVAGYRELRGIADLHPRHGRLQAGTRRLP